MENRCIIVSGGVFGPAPERQPGDFIIACDRGYAYCGRLGLTPDLFIGDTISGVMRLIETVLWAAALALGFALSGWLLGV